MIACVSLSAAMMKLMRCCARCANCCRSHQEPCMERQAQVKRKTGETDITLSLRLDSAGSWSGETGVGFLDHMLELLSRHGHMDLEVKASGDVRVDDHHTTEDIGICLG